MPGPAGADPPRIGEMPPIMSRMIPVLGRMIPGIQSAASRRKRPFRMKKERLRCSRPDLIRD